MNLALIWLHFSSQSSKCLILSLKCFLIIVNWLNTVNWFIMLWDKIYLIILRFSSFLPAKKSQLTMLCIITAHIVIISRALLVLKLCCMKWLTKKSWMSWSFCWKEVQILWSRTQEKDLQLSRQNTRHTLQWLSIFTSCQVLLSYIVIQLMSIELKRIIHDQSIEYIKLLFVHQISYTILFSFSTQIIQRFST